MMHPRGRDVGGNGAIDSFAIIYLPASDTIWAELGNKNWDRKALAPYFLKFQTVVPPNEEVKKQLKFIHSNESIRESDGPIQTAFPSWVTALQELRIITLHILGLEIVSDPLNGSSNEATAVISLSRAP